MDLLREGGASGSLRLGALALLAMALGGTCLTLAYDRHWGEFWQMIPWAAIGAIILSSLALLVRVKAATVWLARFVAVAAIIVAALGIWQHFDENYATAPLDARYSGRWESLSTTSRLWEVASGSVGHVPVLAAAALVPVGATLALITVGLPNEDDSWFRETG